MGLNDIIKPAFTRLQHRSGRFAGNFDYKRGIIQFVDRGGTIEYDLVALTEELQRKEQEVPAATGGNR